MSLFKLKTLWNQNFPQQQFDQKHLSVGKVYQKPCIALASFKGNVRLFIAEKQEKALKVKTIYDNVFQDPVIDIKFVVHPDQNIKYSLGVLFFRKFAFLGVEKNPVQKNYSITVRFVNVQPGFGICVSPLSIMTLNSSIQYLNPVNIQNIKVSDPIFAFARSLQRIYYVDGEQLVLVQGTIEQWRVIVGRVRQLYVINDLVIVIGDKAVWQVCSALINKTKVFDQDISHGTVLVKTDTSYNLVIANFAAQVLLYNDRYQLLWALKVDSNVIKIIVCQHPLIAGALAILTEAGTVQLCYSGTEVPEQSIEPISEQVDIRQVEEQTQRLSEELKRRKNESVNQKSYQENTSSKDKGIQVKIVTDIQQSDQYFDESDHLYKRNDKIVKAYFRCQLKPQRQNLINVQASLILPSNLICKEPEKSFSSMKNKEVINFVVYANKHKFPFQEMCQLTIRYEFSKQKKGPQIYRQTVKIPMGLQCSILNFETAQKVSNKLVVQSSFQLPSFNEIYPQIMPKNTIQQRKSISFNLCNSKICSLTYNKQFNKVKIQTQNYSSLCYAFVEYAYHIKKYAERKNKNIKLMVQIPLQEFFGIMRQHYEFRQKVKVVFEELQKRSQQFRNTQKKLLVKMKQKMSSINHIDKLLQYTYQSLIATANKYERICQQMEISNNNLQVAIKFVTQLLFLRANSNQIAKKKVLGILGYQKESMDFGWQEKVMTNSSHFLNKKYAVSEGINFQKLQKIPLWIIAKVNNGQWNQ